MNPSPAKDSSDRPLVSFGVTLLVLLAVLGLLFAQSFRPEKIHFSSDGPLGASSASYFALPGIFFGIWQDLNWVGGWVGNAVPTLTNLMLWTLGPYGFAKFYAPLALLGLGISVWVFLRQLGFRAGVCLLGGVAAALNTDFLSYACWGLGTLTLSVAWTFLALAALVSPARRGAGLKACAAGAAVGLAIMEGFDTGAIFSLYVAAAVVLQSIATDGVSLRGCWRAAWRLGLVAGLAALTAAAALSMLVSTQIKGVVGMQQEVQTKRQRWKEATQWSLPQLETLRLGVPGLFGYRMDTPDGGNYWGAVGRDSLWDAYFAAPNPDKLKELQGRPLRHSGAGFYAGIMVLLVAAWAVTQHRRRGQNPFSPTERKFISFWAVAGVVSLLFSFGRHAPFYQLIYALPYFSTIRNPIKFLHPLSLALVILFAYGLEGLWRNCLAGKVPTASSVMERLRTWWRQPGNPDRKWTFGSIALVVVGVFGWLRYAASQREMVAYLQRVGFPDSQAATAIARFSVGEVGISLLFLVVCVIWLVLILSRVFSGPQARWAFGGTGLILAIDLLRASAPWVYYWNRDEKYATNPVFEILRDKAYEHRVVLFPGAVNDAMGTLQQLYGVEWLQNGMRYYDIQSLDVVQEPRTSEENRLYRQAFQSGRLAVLVRLWELTNTRFLFGLADGFVDWLNEQFDPALKRFRLHTAFTLTQDHPGGSIGVQTNATGPFALVEFTGALPRTKLYSDWQVVTNDQETLRLLAAPEFVPARQVLVAEPVPSAATAATNQAPGTVEFTRYTPKDLVLRAKTAVPAVLLLNDKYDPRWNVIVDGRPDRVLRCNFLMRGVWLPPGEHTIEFCFRTSVGPLCISLAAIIVGLGLLGLLCFNRRLGAGEPTSVN